MTVTVTVTMHTRRTRARARARARTRRDAWQRSLMSPAFAGAPQYPWLAAHDVHVHALVRAHHSSTCELALDVLGLHGVESLG